MTLNNASVSMIGTRIGGTAKARSFFYVAWLAGIDFLAICTSFFLPWFYRIGIYSQPFSLRYLLAIIAFLGIYYFLTFSEGLYSESAFRRARSSFYRSFKVIILTYGVLLLIAFMFKVTSDFSRVWAVSSFVLLSAYLLVSRFAMARLMSWLATRGISQSRGLFVGEPEIIDRIAQEAMKADGIEAKAVGFVNVRAEGGKDTAALPCLGNLTALEKLIGMHDIDDLIVALPWSDTDQLEKVISIASRRSVNIYLAPEHAVPAGASGKLMKIGNLPLIEIGRKPIDRWHAFLKRLEDLVLGSLALLLLWPVMLAAAIAIKLESKGPILFKQNRYGFNNELIEVYKFRSMYTEMTDHTATTLATRDDPRITRVGRFIRKTSIDELPQLLNVLKGDMSLVGPRPHATHAKAAGKLYEQVVDSYAVRHRVKPGVTGWAQVNGWRGETDTEEKIKGRVEADLYYINNWNLRFDLYILLKTAIVVLFEKENAY